MNKRQRLQQSSTGRIVNLSVSIHRKIQYKTCSDERIHTLSPEKHPMTDVPDFLTTFYITNEFVEEWLDSFNPSIKTSASNFFINVMSRYDFDCDKMVGTEEYEGAVILSQHFDAFIKLKYEEENPDRVAMGFLIPE